MRIKKKIAILFGLILFAFSLTYAQEEEIIEEELYEEEIVSDKINPSVPDTINLSGFYKLLNSDENETTISDYIIITNSEDDKFKVNKIFFSLYELKPESKSGKKLNLYNCKFLLNEKSPLYLSNWFFSKLNIIGCEFFTEIHLNNIKKGNKHELLIENCNFYDKLVFNTFENEPVTLKVRKNFFSTKLSIVSNINELFLERNNFVYDSVKYRRADTESTIYQLLCSDINIQKLSTYGNVFKSNNINNVYSVNLQSSTIGELKLLRDTLKSINLTGSEVEKSLLTDSLFVRDYIGILNFDFPEKNTNASWSNLGGEKFAIFNEVNSGLVIPYQAKSEEQLSKTLYYNDLMSSYNKFNTLYLDRGDRISANASYVEIKNIETRHQAYLQKVSPSFNNLINYKLNEFLRYFSDYATNPGKSLIQSLYVLLFFTIIYMFSFSLWDGMNYRFYLNQFNIFSDYISTNDSIEEVIKKHKSKYSTEDTEDIQKILHSMKERGKRVPRLLRLFGQPLSFLGKFRLEVLPAIVNFLNFQPNSWESTKGFKKVWSGFMILLIALLFLVYILVVKFLNSLILSLNSFVVIGYGALPEQENSIAMYLTIIEGIIGWFLLTIFTITLLSQVLQNA
ncbi:MAG: hypothetical protein C0598_03420 [Marinilabiliales bacterium]|nr:MAG: hypothetical protein C0598_03420 [Marinilabiliales bacterium]